MSDTLQLAFPKTFSNPWQKGIRIEAHLIRIRHEKPATVDVYTPGDGIAETNLQRSVKKTQLSFAT